jgi:hypothetical protein
MGENCCPALMFAVQLGPLPLSSTDLPARRTEQTDMDSHYKERANSLMQPPLDKLDEEADSIDNRPVNDPH